jgi:hypothetical protein
VWTPDVLAQMGRAPVRGFGGRLFFYNERDQSVPVEGQLVVYAYDDSEPASNPAAGAQRQPDRKFVFTAEQFAGHFSTSQLGASYSVWLPWDEAGGQQTSVSLVPVFTSTLGKIVMGQQAVNVLPGRSPEQPEATDMHSQPAIQTVTYQAEAAGRLPRNLQTTTIPLTPNLRHRLAASDQPFATTGPATTTMPPALVAESLLAQQRALQAGQLPSQPASFPPAAGHAAAPPSTHSALPRSQAPARPDRQPDRGPSRFPRHPAGLPYGLPSRPQPALPTADQGSIPMYR